MKTTMSYKCDNEKWLDVKLNQSGEESAYFKLSCFHEFFFCAFQVYEEKEKMWERELRKIKGLYDNRLRASQQKSSKMEQALTNQTYQVRSVVV